MAESKDTNHERRISLLEQSNIQVSAAIDAANGKLDLILAQTTRMAVLEEKHHAQQADVARAHKRASEIERTVNALAVETREFINYSRGRDKVLWTLGFVVFGLLIKALFFASSLGMKP